MTLRASTAGLVLAVLLVTSARAAGPRRDVWPSPVPVGRALAALASHDRVLLALAPGGLGEPIVAREGGRLVSAALRLWQVNGSTARRLVPALSGRGLLRYAEPDYRRLRATHLDQGDPLIPLAWHLERIGADQVEPPGPGVPITIVDTGIDLDHPEFAERPDVVPLNPQSVPSFAEAEYHGTIVASTAGAPSDGVGTVGVYPQAVLRTYDLPGLDDATIIAGIDAAIAAGPSVINLSLGGPGYSRALYEAVMRAVGSGSLVVAAAGNSYLDGNPDIYPADYPHVLTVAALDRANRPEIYSSGSPAVDLATPGEEIPVQDPTDPALYRSYGGTSFAAPIASAAAAWLWTGRPGLDAGQVAELLKGGARDAAKPGFDPRTGFGLLSIPDSLGEPTPPRDPAEPNDDVGLVVAGGVFRNAKPALTTPSRRRSTLTASLDASEDPTDVYRVFVPAGRTLRVSATPDGDLAIALWRPGTRSVLVEGPEARRNLLARSDRRGQTTERVEFRNETGHGLWAFLEARLAGRGGREASYALTARVS